MAEKPILDNRDALGDSGVRPGMSMGDPSARGNNRFKADTQELTELNNAFTQLNTNINKLKTDLPRVITLTEQWAAKMRQVSNAMKETGLGGKSGGGGYIKDAGALSQSLVGGGGGGGGIIFGNVYNVDRSQTAIVGGGGGGAKPGETAKGIAQAVGQVLGPLMQALNARIDRNSQYSLGANRIDMLYQQMTGMDRGGVYNNYRQPLQQYKLGAGGINSVMALQASAGIDARMQGRSVEALRVASGYGYSTDQINQMTRGLASAESANRMFMMGGTGLYGIGGKQRSTMDVVKDTVRRLGLTSESALRGAMAPGSMTRERMRQFGLPEDMQDIVLQYARENMSYQKKTGGAAGMYDPSNKANRKYMGVENAYANQYEETERVKANREENMYNKQADNYAKMEQQMQSLIHTMQRLDDVMSGLTGMKVRNRAFGNVAGGVLKGVGSAAMAAGMVPSPASPFLLAGGAIASVAGSIIGDPTGEKGGVKPDTTGAKQSHPNIAKSQTQLSKLHPKMRERIERMMAENPRLYIGGGIRSTEQQKAMFLDRYRPSEEKTDVFWKGQYWKRVKGAAAAPPGMSMHEIGLAVDFAPNTEFDWVKKNAARFGLRSFFDVNDEPWHVQPAELPASRMKYEQAGAPWGHNGAIGEPTDTKAVIPGVSGMEHQGISSMGGSGAKGGVNIGIQNYSGMSMGETISAMGLEIAGSGGGAAASGGSYGSASSGGSTGSSSPSGKFTGVDAARALYKAGFRGAALVKAVAIAGRESHYNPRAFANDSDDLSYGLMQINMKDDLPKWPNMGKKRLKDFKIPNKEALFDPETNARAAWILSGGGQQFNAWKLNGNPLAKTDLKTATNYVKSAGYSTGDPMGSYEPTYGSGKGNTVIQGDSGNTYHVTISPTIQLQGGNNYHSDVERMARDVSKLLDREVRMTLLRTS